MKSFRDRMARLEALEQRQAEERRPALERRYWLGLPLYTELFLSPLRCEKMIIRDGRFTINDAPFWCDRSGKPHYRGYAIYAAVLNSFNDWGDLFYSESEIAEARDWLARGSLYYGPYRYSVNHAGSRGAVQKWRYDFGMPDTEAHRRDMSFAAGMINKANHLMLAIVAAERRLGPITTIEALEAWLADARPMSVSEEMVLALGPRCGSISFINTVLVYLGIPTNHPVEWYAEMGLYEELTEEDYASIP